MGRKQEKKGKGGALLVLFALIGIVMIGGAWNYQRNLELEAAQQGARPFKGYSDDALQQLYDAYAQEVQTLERRYKASLASRKGVRSGAGLIAENVQEFERVQREGDRIRAATAEVAEREARLREIRAEQNMRGGQSDMMVHMRRLTAI